MAFLSKEQMLAFAVTAAAAYLVTPIALSLVANIPIIGGLGDSAQFALLAGVWGGVGCYVGQNFVGYI